MRCGLTGGCAFVFLSLGTLLGLCSAPTSASAESPLADDVEAYRELLKESPGQQRAEQQNAWEDDWGDSNDLSSGEECADPSCEGVDRQRLERLFQYEAVFDVDAFGANAKSDVAKAILSLVRPDGLLNLRSISVDHGSLPCRVMSDAIGPSDGCFWSLLAGDLNDRDFSKDPLRVGDSILAPEVRIEQREFSRIIDPQWAQLGIGPSVTEFSEGLSDVRTRRLEDATVLVSWNGLRLSFTIRGEEEASRGQEILGNLGLDLTWAVEDTFVEAGIPPSAGGPPNRHRVLQAPVLYSTQHTHQLIEPTQHLGICGVGGTEVGENLNAEGAYVRVLDPDFKGICNTHGLDAPDIEELGYGPNFTGSPSMLPADREARAKVVMIDSGVCAHRDFDIDNIERVKNCGTPLPWTGKCDMAPASDWVSKDHHGTHLAGIIVSRANGEGFVGLNPDARILSHEYNSGTFGDGALADQFKAWREDDDFRDVGGPKGRRLPIYVFAGKFTRPRRLDTDDTPYATSLPRFDLPIANAIKAHAPLLIVAAGQPGKGDTADKAQNITVTSPRSPQNLGGLMNVLVVTGCSPECGRAGAQLDPTTHFSTADSETGLHLVHVAAPSMKLPSTIESDRYISQGGSSQAAAYTAGIAASMIGCFPKKYTRAYQVKKRIQVTSYPSLSPDEMQLLSAGIVDPFVATLHPDKDWLQKRSDAEQWQSKRFKAKKVDGWCSTRLEFANPAIPEVAAGGKYSIETRDILRFVRYRGDTSTGERQWLVYLRNRDESVQHGRPGQHLLGDLQVVGPVALGPELPMVVIDGVPESLSDYEDVILSAAIEEAAHANCDS